MTLEYLKTNTLKVCLQFFAGVFIIALGLGLWWGQEPDIFELNLDLSSIKNINDINYVLNTNSPKRLTAKTYVTSNIKKNGLDDRPYGFIYANTVADLLNEVVNKPGGYFLNDIAPTDTLLDNISSWELGALIAIDDGYIALKHTFYTEDPLVLIEEKYFGREGEQKRRNCLYCSASWRHFLVELLFKDKIKILRDYAQNLKNTNGEQGKRLLDNSYVNLTKYMGVVVYRLREKIELLMTNSERYLRESERPPAGRYFPEHHRELKKATWYSMDNNFYQARGFSWALLPILKAVEIDYNDVFDQRGIYLINRVMYALESALLIDTGFWISQEASVAMASHLYEAKDSAIKLLDLFESKAKLSQSKEE